VSKEKDPHRATTPPQTAQTPPPYAPASDYSFLEIVMTMNHTLGQLTEAVNALKDQSKGHSEELKTISKDLHAAKAVIAVFGTLILAVGGIIAWLVQTYIATHPGARP
jgi:hypothetical protein